jgi:hypothetical protein
MPYVTELKPNSAFLPWIAETDALDWGWLAVYAPNRTRCSSTCAA